MCPYKLGYLLGKGGLHSTGIELHKHVMESSDTYVDILYLGRKEGLKYFRLVKALKGEQA